MAPFVPWNHCHHKHPNKTCTLPIFALDAPYFAGGVWAFEGEILKCPPVEHPFYIPAEA